MLSRFGFGLFVLLLTPDPPLAIDTKSLARTVVVDDLWFVGVLKVAFSLPFALGVVVVDDSGGSGGTMTVFVKGRASCWTRVRLIL